MDRPSSIQNPSVRRPEFKGDYRKASMPDERRPPVRGRTAVWQARLVLLVMINIAQLWILSATVEAALARHYDKLLPLVIASGVCWAISLTIFLWWKPVPKKATSQRGK
jgi:hypothetical protein